MNKEERQSTIMDSLLKSGAVQVSDLSASLEVSSVTIRKDLTELEKAGRLYRSHGKAILINPFTNNRTVNEKEKLSTEEKHAIGMEAAKLITNDDSIVLSSGTTVYAFARCLRPVDRLTVVTPSLQAAEALAQLDNVEVIQLGGIVRNASLSVVGKYSEDILKGFSFSKLYLSVDGIDFHFGISTTDMHEAELCRAMMQTAQKVVVLADSTKFGRRGFAKICNLDDVDTIITDSRVQPSAIRQLEELGIETIVAGS